MDRKSLLIIIFLALSLTASILLVLRTTVFYGRAFTTTKPSASSLQNSYLFASPLTAKADGKYLIRLTVFVLDDRGLGSPGNTVSIQTNTALSVNPVQPITDDSGKAIFDISSDKIGKFQVSASVNSATIPQSVTVSFY